MFEQSDVKAGQVYTGTTKPFEGFRLRVIEVLPERKYYANKARIVIESYSPESLQCLQPMIERNESLGRVERAAELRASMTVPRETERELEWFVQWMRGGHLKLVR